MTNSKEMLQEAQDLLGLNQKELGVYIGVSTRTINSWMTGERECPMHVAELTLRVATEDARKCDNDEPTSGMFRWAVIDELRDGDEFLTVCGSTPSGTAMFIQSIRVAFTTFVDNPGARNLNCPNQALPTYTGGTPAEFLRKL